jgi:sugar/nucleoside kinase (ribokinase family)
MLDDFSHTFVGVTPQGWLRKTDQDGRVYLQDWTALRDTLPQADVVILSLEDIGKNDQTIPDLAEACRLLVLTDGCNGAWVYFQGQHRHIPAHPVNEVDPTGAGDIFAAAFFIHYTHNQNPWESARLATELASCSVTRSGIESTPSREEVNALQAEVC